MQVKSGVIALAIVTSLVVRPLGAQAIPPVRICLMPATVEASKDGETAGEAVRATFATFLSGPSLTSELLKGHGSFPRRARKQNRLTVPSFF